MKFIRLFMNIKLRCAIIDNNQVSNNNLATLIKNHPQLSLIKTYISPLEVFSEINTDPNIHLLFIDTEMPEFIGSELVENLKSKAKLIIHTISDLKYTLNSHELGTD